MSLLVSVTAVGGLLAVRAQRRVADALEDSDNATLYARAGTEVGRHLITTDAQWRTTKGDGVWLSGQPVGAGTFTLEAYDPVDGAVATGPNDPVVLRSTGTCGGARQIMEVTLQASPSPLPSLRAAVHTAGQFHLRAGKTFTAAGSIVSTNGEVRNDGTISAGVEAQSLSGSTLTVPAPYVVTAPAPPKAFPPRRVIDFYAGLGTAISPGNVIEKQVLSPGRNPYGSTNPDAVYVVRTSSDLTIRNARINGTLVVICPGRKVTLDSVLFMHAARADYPVLIVDGNAVLQYGSGAANVLSESAAGANFNPAGAPYGGVTDGDTSDTYPSEVRGLVHVTGSVTFAQTALVRGTVLCESAATADAVDCGGTNEIVYDPGLYARPPQGYAESVKMPVLAGSYKKVVQ